MLACHEGMSFLFGTKKFCEYDIVRPFNTGLNGKYTTWGSTKNTDTPYREVMAAVGYAKKIPELVNPDIAGCVEEIR